MKNKKFKASWITVPIVIIIIITMSISSYLILSYYNSTNNSSAYKSFTVSKNNQTFSFTYVALTEQQSEAGLMNKTVTNSTFMLFVFPKSAIYPFWMLNTYYNLDMIWLNESKVQNGSIITNVVYIQQNATPCLHETTCALYTPTGISDFVIEAKSGFVKAHSITIGSVVKING